MEADPSPPSRSPSESALTMRSALTSAFERSPGVAFSVPVRGLSSLAFLKALMSDRLSSYDLMYRQSTTFTLSTSFS